MNIDASTSSASSVKLEIAVEIAKEIMSADPERVKQEAAKQNTTQSKAVASLAFKIADALYEEYETRSQKESNV